MALASRAAGSPAFDHLGMGVLGLVQVLTCSSEAQRFEWARHLLLQAKQHEPQR